MIRRTNFKKIEKFISRDHFEKNFFLKPFQGVGIGLSNYVLYLNNYIYISVYHKYRKR